MSCLYLALLWRFVVFFVTFPYGVLGQVWYLIVLVLDLCLPFYFVDYCQYFAYFGPTQPREENNHKCLYTGDWKCGKFTVNLEIFARAIFLRSFVK